MSTLEFEGREVAVLSGDTIASALFRSGVRVFSRSFKFHRPRGLYCLTGDCPNCLVTVDGGPNVRACVTDASSGQRVERQNGWPSTDRDVLRALDRLKPLLPVGFYYKTLIRPRWLFPATEPWIRRLAGLGTVSNAARTPRSDVRNVHIDLVVIGGGIAGLSAALAGSERSHHVLLCDEGRLGEKVAPGTTRSRIDALAERARGDPNVTILERTAAIGIYEGPLAVLNGDGMLHLVHPKSIVVATGALEEHAVFPGADLPGVWLGRGAARLAGVHGVAPGKRAVVIGQTWETDWIADTLRRSGALVEVHHDARIVEARGHGRLERVVIERDGHRSSHSCEALVIARALIPRDDLARQGVGFDVTAAGDVALPGCTPDEAEASGRSAAGAGPARPAEATRLWPPEAGIVCLCEDVTVDELDHAWQEGFRSTELLKRYTTATMGPCRGALCHCHLRAFVCSRPGATGPRDGPTTSRPPIRPITLAEVAAGRQVKLEQRTALHDRHSALGAKMEPAAGWQRAEHYGDVDDEYWAVRRDVSVMDAGSLGKYQIVGRDATDFVDRFLPCQVRDLAPGRLRYALMLGEHGSVVDDGLVCALDGGRWYMTFSSGGGATAAATLRDWAETWNLEIHVIDLTSVCGVINVAGPRARQLLQRLCDERIDNDSFPYLHHRELTVAGVGCRVIRLGFVGELSYELHHPSWSSTELWDTLLTGGASLGVRPHGLDAVRLLRLEKGHIIVGQDSDFDSTPEKVGMAWAVRMSKPDFVGRIALQRMSRTELDRKLVAITFDGAAPPEGATLMAHNRPVGYLTSSRYSPVLERGVALGWMASVDGAFARHVTAEALNGTVVTPPFYDPKGARVRA